MPQQQTQQDLARAIERSILLSPDRKERLLSLIPTLDETKLSRLFEILRSEWPILDAVAGFTVDIAAKRGEGGALVHFQNSISTSAKELRKGQERMEESKEEKREEELEQFFLGE
jgi:hypothetical protein